MANADIRCLTRLVPVDNWREGYTESCISLGIYIRKAGNRFAVGIVAKDKDGLGFKKESVVDTLSLAATEYERLLENYFHTIPDNVTASWFEQNGFSDLS